MEGTRTSPVSQLQGSVRRAEDQSIPGSESPPSKRAKVADFGALPPASEEAIAASEAQPRQLQPNAAPKQSWFLIVKKGYWRDGDYGREFAEGHAQVVVPGNCYFGLTYGSYREDGKRGFTMNDELRMRNPDIAIGGELRPGGLAAMREAEASLEESAKSVCYDRAGKAGMNCLIAAARIVEAATGAKLPSFKPAGGLGEFAVDVNNDLVDAQVPFEWHDGKALESLKKQWAGVRDKNPSIRGQES